MAGLPGGLVHTNIVGCTVFAAVSGSSAATLTTVGKMSIPELRKRNYPEHMIIGTLAGAATLGLMIPPSLTLIVYGVTINESISKLFIAGVVPGLVLAADVHGLCRDLFQAFQKLQSGLGTQDEHCSEDCELALSDPGHLPDPGGDRFDVSRLRDRDGGGGLRRDRRACAGGRTGFA